MNKVTRNEGRYYYGESENQASYTFYLREDAPENLERSYIIRLEHDLGWSGSPLEVATGIMEMWEDFWLAPQLPKIKDIVLYLQQWERQDKIDSLVEEKNQIEERLAEIENEMEELDAYTRTHC